MPSPTNSGAAITPPTIFEWSSASFGPRSSYDAWVDVLNQAYGSWDARTPSTDNFSANLMAATFGELSVIKCVCDPCFAKRDRLDISRDDNDFVAFQLVLEGKEQMLFNGEKYALERGDIFIWDSKHPMTFEVTERLSKVSVVLPLKFLRKWMPETWDNFGRKLDQQSSSKNLLTPLIASLSTDSVLQSSMDESYISEAFSAILAGGAQTTAPSLANGRIKDSQLATIKSYIRRRIGDTELSISSIAQHHKISNRYLHWLFKEDGESASKFILKTRLEVARRELLTKNKQLRSLAEIAYDCGFASYAHFSRCYKDLYQESPSATRSVLGAVN